MIETVAPSRAIARSLWREGMDDLVAGAGRWRLSYLLGVGEIRRRYARSRLGQFWVTLTTAMTIFALGFVWSQLWRAPIADMMPFVVISMIAWTYISGVLNEAPTVFVSAGPIVHNQGIDFSTIVYGMMLKQIVILLHNLPIYLITMIIFRSFPGPAGLGALLGLGLLTIFLFGLGFMLAIVSLRFRDLAQLVQNVTTMLFFVTPVLWKPSQVGGDHAYLLAFNPFAVYLATIQKSLLGDWPTLSEWGTAIGLAVAAAILVVPVAGWARRRLIYWL